MDKLKMHSPDMTEQNIEKLLALFPNCKTEKQNAKGELETAIDFDLLKQELLKNIVEGPQERYQLNWPGKKEALLTANVPIAKTLRPCREESVDFDTTENLFIEGDNLDALKLLQETYLGKVKMIYIDPPYNTGKDFIYNDDFSESSEEYLLGSEQRDEDGNRLIANTESNGRFHSDWLSMMYARLKLARNLLSDDGVIFISIDDNECSNLRRFCDEIFGEANFVAQLTVVVKPEGRRYGFFAKTHEYVIVYCKNHEYAGFNEILVEGSEHSHSDEIGGFTLKGLRNRNVQAFNSTNRPNLRYPFYVDVKNPDDNGFYKVTTTPLDGHSEVEASTVNGLKSVWRWGKEKSEKEKGSLLAYKGKDGEIRIFQKERKLSQMAKTVLADKQFISNKGTKELQFLLGKGIFDFPKPVSLIKLMLMIGTNEDSLILDFFAGSATAAHAIMKLNEEDGGARKFIMVQLPESCNEQSEAFKTGYKTIAEISKERIRRAGTKIKQENPEVKDLDIGFRVLKIDSSNMNEVNYTPDTVNKDDLFNQVEHIKADRSAEDLLFQVMLDWGVDLSLPISKQSIEGKNVYFVNDSGQHLSEAAPCDLAACFEKDIDEALIKALAAKAPLRVVFRDDGFISDSVKINVEQIFKQLAPATDIKVI
jgi:adenine-specific DNA-methyltransferase